MFSLMWKNYFVVVVVVNFLWGNEWKYSSYKSSPTEPNLQNRKVCEEEKENALEGPVNGIKGAARRSNKTQMMTCKQSQK